jgi:glycosyltransferase involved in cell wall biosynthesis
LRALVSLYHLIRDGGFDIVHTHMSKAALIGGFAAWLAEAPVKVNTAHNLGCLAMPWVWLRALFWLYEKILLTLTTDAVVTVSRQVRDTLLRKRLLSADRVFAIPNGIPGAPKIRGVEARARLIAEIGRQDATFIVGSVARLVWFKGLHLLVEAAASIVKAHPNSVFVIVGDGPLRTELERQAESLGVAGQFVFMGERQNVLEILHGLDLFVLPSVSEGMPVTILEAMAAAVPVVATIAGGIPELVSDGATGLLVPPHDPNALAAAILNLLQDPARRAAMGAAGRERVARQFSADTMVSATDQLFRQLLAAKPGTAIALDAQDAVQDIHTRH